jgi:lysophospholipase L1-like esterase
VKKNLCSKNRKTLSSLCLSAGLALLTSTYAHADPKRGGDPTTGEVYYISMGDSLATGAQLNPNTGHAEETNQSYTDQIYRSLRKANPRLKHIRLGCGGETAASMINGNVCNYGQGNQLSEALSQISNHQGRVVLLTLNIGANDIAFSGCLGIPDPAQQSVCLQGVFQGLGGNLNHILQQITGVAQNQFPIVAANLTNPYLSSWLQGPQGVAFAQLSAQLELSANLHVFQPIYGAFGVKTANLAKAFHSQDFATKVSSGLPSPNNVLPLNVAMICRYTYACPLPSSGLPVDFHFNTAGYSIIAREFLEAVRR